MKKIIIKRLIETILVVAVYFLVTLFLNRDDIDWSGIILTSSVFAVLYFVSSVIIDNYMAKKSDKK